MSISILGRARAWGMVSAGAVSAGAALLLGFKLITPDTIGSLATAELLGLLALLVLPVGAACAVRHVRTERAEAGAALAAQATAAPVRPASKAPPTLRRAA